MRIRAPKDFWAGVMFFGFAVVAVLAARGYSLGSAGRMGPGYFPLLLGLVLGGLGALLIGRSLVLDGEPVPRLHVVPLAIIAVGGVPVRPGDRAARPRRLARHPGRALGLGRAAIPAWSRRGAGAGA